ncbi:MAG: DUF4363 family protein [Clostridium sp.]|uniref:DUF4363 family protein n=1 Tax=Clostridium sp. TaxID=1506 RepID=UPI003EE5EA96
MKNRIISLILFFSLIFLVFYATKKLNNLYEYIESTCNAMEEAIEKYDFNTSYELSIKLLTIIEQDDAFCSFYVSHYDTEILMTNCISVATSSRSESYGDSLTAIYILKVSAKTMKNFQKPNLENIF